jgi:hypothetical protein
VPNGAIHVSINAHSTAGSNTFLKRDGETKEKKREERKEKRGERRRKEEKGDINR